ncbi:hypothetical protein BH11PSE11_BH11PSE11_02800 [soil metagenome]
MRICSQTLSSARQSAGPSIRLDPSLRAIRRLAVIAMLSLLALPAYSETNAPAIKPFTMAADGDPGTYGSRWVRLIYTEVFKRLGLPFQLEHYTLARRAALVEEGGADGETSRVYAYGTTRPSLVRVEESLIDLSFGLYTANPSLRLAKLDELRSADYLVEYRRGILLCENTLKPVVQAERLSDVPTQTQGLKKLVAGRTDLYCDIDVYILQELQAPEFKGVTTVRRVMSIGNAVPTYPYLNKKHAELAPRMAAVIKQMKTEGLIETYRLQVERDLGWK